MSSVYVGPKQTNGYFLVTGAVTALQAYAISTAGSGSGGSYVSPILTVAGTLPTLAAGMVLKDMGKTITTGSVGQTSTTVAGVTGLSPRVFRKVQLTNQGRTVATSTTNVANGIGGSQPGGTGFLGTDVGSLGAGYNTFYIELPTSGSPVATVANFANLTYITGMPSFPY